jgi:hypothetical protein
LLLSLQGDPEGRLIMGDLTRSEGITPANSARALTEALSAQHIFHGMLGRVYERMGGEDFLFEWAQDNPGRFLTMLASSTPSVAPTQGITGDVTLHVHATLAPTELDVVSEQ